MKKLFFLSVLIVSFFSVMPQQVGIIPLPDKYTKLEGAFFLNTWEAMKYILAMSSGIQIKMYSN